MVFISTDQAIVILRPVGLFVLGMVIYSIFIFKFYRFLARKEIISLNLSKYNTTKFAFPKKIFGFLLFLLQYILIFPILIFFWFAFLTVLLVFLSKQPIENIILVSIALVTTVRIVSYYSYNLAQDLSKMLPFTLLGLFLIDISYFSFENSIAVLEQIPSTVNTLVYYLIFVMGVELLMRIITLFFKIESSNN